MKKSDKPAKNRANKPSKPVKQPLLEAFSDLEYELQVLTLQLRILRSAEALPKNHSHRKVTERFLELFNSLEQMHLASEAFKELLYAKRPGGDLPNEHRPTAFNLLRDHYINTSTVMKAPDLVAAVKATLPKGTPLSDADGKEVFSTRVARDVRKRFKSAITIDFDDVN